jgi:hypothetical protein
MIPSLPVPLSNLTFTLSSETFNIEPDSVDYGGLTEFKDRANRRQKFMSYDLEKINKSIAECLSGSGTYEDLQRFRAEKAEIEERAYFDRIQTIKAEISALQAQRLADVETQKVLELDLQIASKELDKQAGILQEKREIHADINGRLLLMKFGFDNNRLTTNEKKAELNDLIKNKITEQI